MTVVRFRRNGDNYVVNFRYDARLVELVKSIPAQARSYDPVTRSWYIDMPFAIELANDLRIRGYTVVGLDTQYRHHDDHVDVAQWAELLLRRVGDDRADAVFRALTRVLHPDNQKTGDVQLQQELNAARENGVGAGAA